MNLHYIYTIDISAQECCKRIFESNIILSEVKLYFDDGKEESTTSVEIFSYNDFLNNAYNASIEGIVFKGKLDNKYIGIYLSWKNVINIYTDTKEEVDVGKVIKILFGKDKV